MITINNFKNYNVDQPVDQIFIIKNFLHLDEIDELLILLIMLMNNFGMKNI